YTLNNDDPDTQALKAGEPATEQFTYTVSDEHFATSTTTLTLAITGTNDIPIAVADDNAVVESGVKPGNTPFTGNPLATGNVLANDVDADHGSSIHVSAFNGSAANVGQSLTGIYGSLTLNLDGSYTYVLDNTDPDTEALAFRDPLVAGTIGLDVFS